MICSNSSRVLPAPRRGLRRFSWPIEETRRSLVVVPGIDQALVGEREQLAGDAAYSAPASPPWKSVRPQPSIRSASPVKTRSSRAYAKWPSVWPGVCSGRSASRPT
jgi:hypothetical protein